MNSIKRPKDKKYNSGYGISDNPCTNLEEDCLNIGSYIKGLEEFVLNCPTPMSIALQGDWGTGKTSFLQSMQSDFGKLKPVVKTIYFNTWQYSQFKMSENLYASFISNILNALGEESQDNEVVEKIKSITKTVFKISSRIAINAIKDATNINIDELESEIALKELEKAESIRSLKEKFANVVDKTKGDRGRIVIFVDDLDRLNPEIAVELLEVMKLFMDVPNCIFVLAIDYEIVVKGIRKKFGNDMSDEKCRSFFDKIIQLPFSMPVASYCIENMLENILGDTIKKYITPIGILVKNSLGTNPRTIKRLANSFFLLSVVEKNMKREVEEDAKRALQAALLFVSLVVQMYSNDAYKRLIECGDEEELNKLIGECKDETSGASENDKEDEDSGDEEIFGLVNIALRNIAQIAEIEEIYEDFYKAIMLSSITSIEKVSDEGNNKRKKAMKVTSVVIGGKSYNVKNPTYAQIRTFEEILKKDESRIKAFMEAYPSILTTDPNLKSGYFRASKPTCLTVDNKKVYIGTSSSSADKIIRTRELCEFMGMKNGEVAWYNEEQKVF